MLFDFVFIPRVILPWVWKGLGTCGLLAHRIWKKWRRYCRCHERVKSVDFMLIRRQMFWGGGVLISYKFLKEGLSSHWGKDLSLHHFRRSKLLYCERAYGEEQGIMGGLRNTPGWQNENKNLSPATARRWIIPTPWACWRADLSLLESLMGTQL